MKLWFTELQTPDLAISCRFKEVLYREKSPYQEIIVIDTVQFGRMLVLDDVIQTTEKDEFVYHEMITHVPLTAHPDPRRVLVIGGGDGGTIREVLKHGEVERATLAEIDEKVVEAARRFLPTISQGLSDPRAEVAIGDGIARVKEAEGEYDVIIVDSTDPVGPAVGLFSEEFYRAVHRALKDDGLFVAQTESPFFNESFLRRVLPTIGGIFPKVSLYLASVPTYPGGMWSFTIGSKRYDPADFDRQRAEALDTRYYTPELHEKAFVLPRFVEEILRESVK